MSELKRFTRVILASLGIIGLSGAVSAQNLTLYVYDGQAMLASELAAHIRNFAEQESFVLDEYDGLNSDSDTLSMTGSMDGSVVPVVYIPKNTQSAFQSSDNAKIVGVPIVFLGNDPGKQTMENYDGAYRIGVDQSELGAIQADMLSMIFAAHPEYDRNHNGKLDILVLRGTPDRIDGTERTTAFNNRVRDSHYPFWILNEVECDWNGQQAYLYFNNLFGGREIDTIEAVAANNDAMALGALHALQGHGYNRGNGGQAIPLVGIGGVQEAVTSVERGFINGTVDERLDAQAAAAVALIKDLLDGRLDPDFSRLAEPPVVASDRNYVFRPRPLIAGQGK